MKNTYHTYADTLKQLKQSNQLRALKEVDTRTDKTIFFKGTPCLNLTSNDYLGLATDIELCRAFYNSIDQSDSATLVNSYGLGSSSSRLLTGNSQLYEALESRLCQWYGLDAALLFNSGYHANLGIIPALAGKNDLIFSDSLNHASIIDGIRLSNARCEVFEHNDTRALAELLKKMRPHFKNVVIITESLFSMDGDRADIEALVELKCKHNAMLYIDEAHSVGIYGAQGQGLCFETGLADQVDILLGTMGKALASHGAYIMTNSTLKSYLVNSARSLIFSTALPPLAVSWNLFLLEQMAAFDDRRTRLKQVSKEFRAALMKQGLTIAGDSHIVPVITKSNKRTVDISDALIKKGFLAFPIRPPSVPKNNSRIRFSITSDILFEDVKEVPVLISDSMENHNTKTLQLQEEY